MTLCEAYAYGQEQLKNAGIEDAVLDAWYLLEFTTGISRAQYFLCRDTEVSREQEVLYKEHIENKMIVQKVVLEW